jgi:hypothetical protein
VRFAEPVQGFDGLLGPADRAFRGEGHGGLQAGGDRGERPPARFGPSHSP